MDPDVVTQVTQAVQAANTCKDTSSTLLPRLKAANASCQGTQLGLFSSPFQTSISTSEEELSLMVVMRDFAQCTKTRLNSNEEVLQNISDSLQQTQRMMRVAQGQQLEQAYAIRNLYERDAKLQR